MLHYRLLNSIPTISSIPTNSSTLVSKSSRLLSKASICQNKNKIRSGVKIAAMMASTVEVGKHINKEQNQPDENSVLTEKGERDKLSWHDCLAFNPSPSAEAAFVLWRLLFSIDISVWSVTIQLEINIFINKYRIISIWSVL